MIRFNFLSVLILILCIANQSWSNYLGADVQTFTATEDQLDLITVQSGHTIQMGWWNFGVYTSYSQNNLLVYSIPITDQLKQKPKDTLWGAQADIAFGLTPHLEWGLTLPVYLNQSVDNDLYRKLYIQKGIVSIRNHLKYSLSESKSKDGAAVIASIEIPNVSNDPYIGKSARPIFIFEIAYDMKTKQSVFAINGGFKIRQPSDPIDQATMWPLGNEILYSLGWAHRFSENSAISYVLELDGSSPMGDPNYKNPSEISTLEGIVGLKGLMKSFSTWNVGFGFKALSQGMSPDNRIFFGYTWSWPNSRVVKNDILLEPHGPMDSGFSSQQNKDKWKSQMNPSFEDDSDHDGVPDDRDECPGTPAGIPVDSFGCPFDSDKDGVYDYEDECPNTPLGDIVDRRGCTVKY